MMPPKTNSQAYLRWIYIGSGTGIFLVIILFFQNLDRVAVKILFWQIHIPKLIMALIFFGLGYLAAQFVKKPRPKRSSS